MSERQMIVAGLLLFSTSGLVPLVVQDYPLIFLSRFSLWFGDRNDQCQGYFDYQWTLLRQWQDSDAGLSGSAEVVGSAILTLLLDNSTPRLASDLCRIWRWLLDFTPLYPFVPYPKGKNRLAWRRKKKGSARLRSPQWRFSLMLAVIAGIIICFNSIISLRAGYHCWRSYGNGDNSWNSP